MSCIAHRYDERVLIDAHVHERIAHKTLSQSHTATHCMRLTLPLLLTSSYSRVRFHPPTTTEASSMATKKAAKKKPAKKAKKVA